MKPRVTFGVTDPRDFVEPEPPCVQCSHAKDAHHDRIGCVFNEGRPCVCAQYQAPEPLPPAEEDEL